MIFFIPKYYLEGVRKDHVLPKLTYNDVKEHPVVLSNLSSLCIGIVSAKSEKRNPHHMIKI